MKREEWRDVVGWKGWYQVSSLGRVKRIRQGCGTRVGRILIPERHWKGYRRVTLSRHSKTQTFRVHRLVLNAFTGKPKRKAQCDHLNNNKADNRLVNLEWVTPEENIRRRYAACT